MPASVDLAPLDVLPYVVRFLNTLTGATVIQGLQNGVAMPEGGFIVVTYLGAVVKGTNEWTYDKDTQERHTTANQELRVQIDVYGLDCAEMIAAMLRDMNAGLSFPAGAQPEYVTDPMRVDFIDAEKQFETRWTMDLLLSYRPVISDTQQSALALSINTIEATS